MTPEQEYQRRSVTWKAQSESYARLDAQLSRARGAVALLVVLVGYFTFGSWWFGLGLVPVAVFIGLVIWHERNARRQQLAQRAMRHYDLGLARLHGTWQGKGNAGEAYRDAEHPYADDLDVFGAGSLFELVSTARSQPGEARLAQWLLTAADEAEVLARQEVVRDLAPRLDLREEMALLGDDVRAGIHAEKLAAWGTAAPVKMFAGARWLMLVLALMSGAAFVGWLAQLWPLLWFFGVMLVVMPLSMLLRPAIGRMIEHLDARAHDLSLIAALLGRLENEKFTSARLQTLQAELSANGMTASEQIHQLRKLMDWLEGDLNPFFALPAFCLLWRPQFSFAIERWRRQAGPHLGRWVEVLAEMEALASLAAFAYEHPAAVYPELVSGGRVFAAQALAHPLIPEQRAVANDLEFGEAPRLLIVSGSNMSGKSTLMRAVGLNAALAWAGAPVCARSLRVSPFTIGASLRANDSLLEGRSRFYAEIRRLRQVVDLAGGERPLLFLIDEVLSGTNSHDRRIGAEAILKGLLERGACGLTTTHDLALTRIPEVLAGQALNVHFQDEMVDGHLHFDYRLRPGVVERSNALDLMRSIGLKV